MCAVENYAPIVLFVYNRLDHCKKTISALQKNDLADKSDLYIYSDAAKNDKLQEDVDSVRSFLHSIDGFKSVTIIERDENYGLMRNIIEGVTDVVNRYGTVIVLEDDIVTSKYFLKYMNDALEKYFYDSRVMEISGFAYPMKREGLPELMFLKFCDCWGWATWKRSWDLFERNPAKLVKTFSRKDIFHFNMENSADFWGQVVDNYSGDIKTWAIFWSATLYQNNGLMLYPRDSLVYNIGFDGTGEHEEGTDFYNAVLRQSPYNEFPETIEENKKARDYFKEYLRKPENGGKIKTRVHIKRCLKTILCNIKQHHSN